MRRKIKYLIITLFVGFILGFFIPKCKAQLNGNFRRLQCDTLKPRPVSLGGNGILSVPDPDHFKIKDTTFRTWTKAVAAKGTVASTIKASDTTRWASGAKNCVMVAAKCSNFFDANYVFTTLDCDTTNSKTGNSYDFEWFLNGETFAVTKSTTAITTINITETYVIIVKDLTLHCKAISSVTVHKFSISVY